MKKRLVVLLVLTMALGSLAGCGQKADENGNASAAQNQTQQAEKQEEQPENATTKAEDLKSAAYLTLLQSGRYLMHYTTDYQEEGKTIQVDATIAEDGDKLFYQTDMKGVSTKMIYTDGTMYLVDDDRSMYMALGMKREEAEVVNAGTELAYTQTTEETLDGRTLTCEAYSDGENELKFYFDQDELTDIVSKDAQGTVALHITELSDAVSDDLFRLPEGYQDLSGKTKQ